MNELTPKCKKCGAFMHVQKMGSIWGYMCPCEPPPYEANSIEAAYDKIFHEHESAIIKDEMAQSLSDPEDLALVNKSAFPTPEEEVTRYYHEFLRDIQKRLEDRVPEMLELFKIKNNHEISRRGNRYVSQVSPGIIYAWDDRLVLFSYFRPSPVQWFIRFIDLEDNEENRARFFNQNQI